MFVRILIFLLLVLCVVMGVHYVKREFGVGPGLPNLTAGWQSDLTPPPTLIPSLPTDADNQQTASDSVRQQIGSLLAIPLILDEDGVASNSVSLAFVQEHQPLMVVLFGTDISATAAAAVTSQLHQLPNPPLVAVDHEGGTVQRLAGSGFTTLPSWQQLCALQPEVRGDLIASSAAQLQQAGIDVVLGPVVDRAASGSALRSRSCSADPEKIAAVAQQLISIYKEVDIATMLKHYPGIGSSRSDLHTQSAKTTIKADDTRPFEILMANDPTLSVMVSHLRIDPADPETPCSMSYLCVGELHRVFPDAILVSDALEMKSAGYLTGSSTIQRPLSERPTAVLRAGVDVALFGPSVTEADLTAVINQLEKDFTISGRLDAKATTHVLRANQWRAIIQQ